MNENEHSFKQLVEDAENAIKEFKENSPFIEIDKTSQVVDWLDGLLYYLRQHKYATVMLRGEQCLHVDVEAIANTCEYLSFFDVINNLHLFNFVQPPYETYSLFGGLSAIDENCLNRLLRKRIEHNCNNQYVKKKIN